MKLVKSIFLCFLLFASISCDQHLGKDESGENISVNDLRLSLLNDRKEYMLELFEYEMTLWYEDFRCSSVCDLEPILDLL